jgi:hypothetical protein
MLTLFCAIGYLEKKSGVFHLTEGAREFLVRSSPWFIGPYYAHMADRPIYRSLLETLQTDKPGRWAGAKSRKPWTEETKDDAFAEQCSLSGSTYRVDVAYSTWPAGRGSRRVALPQRILTSGQPCLSGRRSTVLRRNASRNGDLPT